MVSKSVRSGECASAGVARGVNLIADLVSVTLGPAGRAVLVGRTHAPTLLLRNGHAISQEVDVEEGERQMGVQAMRELAWRTSDQVGDGTSTAIVMARAVVNEGIRAIAAGIAPAVLQKAIDTHCSRLVAELDSMGAPIGDDSQLVRVATQAAGGDSAIGKLLADVHVKAGLDGVVQIEEGHGTGDEARFVPGLHFDQGWISPHFVDDQDSQSVEMDDPLILLHLAPINDLNPIVPVLEMMAKARRGLVIVAENVGGAALAALIVNKQRAGLKVAAVKAPGTGLWRQLMLDDIAIATGATVISDQLGTTLSNLRPQMAGRAKRIRIDSTGTTIFGGGGDPALVQARIRELRDAIAHEKDLSFDREQHQKRLAWLAAGIGMIRMGGGTESEIRDRRNRAKAASAAVRAAQLGGAVAGGSAALVHAERRARRALPKDLTGRVVTRILAAAVEAPLRAIAENAGDDGRAVVARVAASGGTLCYDAARRSFPPPDALCDPLPVVRASLVNSISTASRLLGIGATIASRVA
jgi:chaperonin GroEL